MRVEAAFDALPFACCAFTPPDDRIQWFNLGWTVHFDYDEDELVRRPFHELVVEADRLAWQHHLAYLSLSTAKFAQFELQLSSRRHAPMRFEFEGMRVEERVVLMGRSRLPTAERRLREMRLAAVAYQGSRRALVVVDAKTRRIEGMNEQARKLLAPVVGFVRGSNLDAHFPRSLALIEGSAQTVRLKTGAGADLDLRVLVGRREGGLMTLTLEEGEAQSAELMPVDEVAMSCHDLRTPLTSVVASLSLLKNSPQLDPAFLELLEVAERGAQSMEGLLERLMRSTGLIDGQSRMRIDEVDLGQLTREVVSLQALRADELGVPVKVRLDAQLGPVRGDGVELSRVLGNLLSNALRFSTRGSSIEIDVAAAGLGSWLRIEVCDRGPGVPASFRRQLFEKGASTSLGSARGQSGLGLFLSREIARRHGGELRYENRPGGGARFILELPGSANDAGGARHGIV
ncbi:MAG: HAMP domain-containing sensor histidine kinase [Myxococcota bacterium]